MAAAVTPLPTPWQLAAECARACLEDAREGLSEAAWPLLVDFLALITAREQQKILLRELRNKGASRVIQRLTQAERARIDERSRDPKSFERVEQAAEAERLADRRFRAAVVVGRDAKTCHSICSGKPVRVGNLDRFVLRGALRGGRRPHAEGYIVVSPEMLDAIDEAGTLPEREAKKAMSPLAPEFGSLPEDPDDRARTGSRPGSRRSPARERGRTVRGPRKPAPADLEAGASTHTGPPVTSWGRSSRSSSRRRPPPVPPTRGCRRAATVDACKGRSSPSRRSSPGTQPSSAPTCSTRSRSSSTPTSSRPRSADALALWTAYSHVFDCFGVSPILDFSSPTKRCGKSSAVVVPRHLCRAPLLSGNITPAALFRAVEAWKPTLLIDEADTFAKMNDELRGILNAGHTRDTAFVVRAEGDSNEPRLFSTWAPKLVAAIGRLPDTIEDRSIRIVLTRKPVERQEAGRVRPRAVRRDCERRAPPARPLRARRPRRDRDGRGRAPRRSERSRLEQLEAAVRGRGGRRRRLARPGRARPRSP